jgi:ribosomal protein S27AE
VTYNWPMLGHVSEQIICPECGSGSLVASGVFEHGTWIYRLTCWTCRDCQTIVAFPEGDASALYPEANVNPTLGTESAPASRT